jgi:hypothetical protein
MASRTPGLPLVPWHLLVDIPAHGCWLDGVSAFWGCSQAGVTDSNCQLHLSDVCPALVPQADAAAATQSHLLVWMQLHVAHGQQLELGLLLLQEENPHSHLHIMRPQ